MKSDRTSRQQSCLSLTADEFRDTVTAERGEGEVSWQHDVKLEYPCRLASINPIPPLNAWTDPPTPGVYISEEIPVSKLYFHLLLPPLCPKMSLPQPDIFGRL